MTIKKHTIEWQKLLSQDKLRTKSNTSKDQTDQRTAFDSDYDRIIFSSVFRRLQDKAQVFPLENNDFVRTRLTHSLEVAAIAESIGISIGNFLCANSDTFKPEDISKLKKILQCVGLLHDIGNTPFGHFGEQAIQDYFINFFNYYEKTYADSVPNKNIFCDIKSKLAISAKNPSLKKDLEFYDGNAQALRNICELQSMQSPCGLNLTCGTLSALIKYPRSSSDGNRKDKGVSYKKYGYLQSESKFFNTIINLTGLIDKDNNVLRNPIVYILEAADDIAYSASDIEDGIKKGLLTIDDLKKAIFDVFTKKYSIDFDDNDTKNSLLSTISKDKTFNLIKNSGNISDLIIYSKINKKEKAIMNSIYAPIETGNPNDPYIRAQMIRISVQGYMIPCVVRAFEENYSSIMDGIFEKELLLESDAKDLRKALENLTKTKIFNSKEILKNELAGYKVVTRLLDLFITAIVIDKGTKKSNRLKNLISENYRNLYDVKNTPTIFDDIQLVVDFISGMTDYYALDLYKHLQGIII